MLSNPTLADVVARCKASVSVAINQNRDYYEDRRSYLSRGKDLTHGELERLLTLENLYELQFYPDTPVGSYKVYGGSLEDVCAQAIAILEENRQ